MDPGDKPRDDSGVCTGASWSRRLLQRDSRGHRLHRHSHWGLGLGFTFVPFASPHPWGPGYAVEPPPFAYERRTPRGLENQSWKDSGDWHGGEMDGHWFIQCITRWLRGRDSFDLAREWTRRLRRAILPRL